MNDKIRQLVAVYSNAKQDILALLMEDISHEARDAEETKEIIEDLRFLEDGEDLVESLNIMINEGRSE